MKKMIITIGRQFGSGGHEIGKKLAEKLDLTFVDEQLIEEAARALGKDPEKVKELDETSRSGSARTKGSGDYQVMKNAPMYQFTQQDRLFELEAEAIRNAAEKPCVIVGHCGNYVLRDMPLTLSAYIYAPEEFRIERVMHEYGAPDRETAKRDIQRMDKVRRKYYQYYADYEWGGKEGRDILIDSSLLGIDGTVTILKELAERHFSVM